MAVDYRPFVFYGGNCRDAFTRYQEILGGDLALLTLGDAPSEDPVPPGQADLIIHAALTADGAYVMGSDDPTGEFGGIQGMSVSVSVDTADEARRVFDLDGPQLISVASTLASGRYLSGRSLEPAPSLFVGAVENPGAPPFDYRPSRARKKIESVVLRETWGSRSRSASSA